MTCRELAMFLNMVQNKFGGGYFIIYLIIRFLVNRKIL